MYKILPKSIGLILLISLFFSISLIKGGFGNTAEEQNEELLLKKIDPELLNLQGETSVIVEFSKKPKNYKQLIRLLGGSITHDYGSLDAVAVKIKGEDIPKLANFENLIKVHKNGKVKALLQNSAPLISADDIWNLGFTGKDVKVCVIDTGIDYKCPALGSCSPLVTNGNVEPYILESFHPYRASYNYTWTITKPSYTNIAVHFVNISLDPDYDFIYIKDANGNTLQNFTGDYNDIWSVSVPGDTIKINLVSDWYLSLYGFYIDNVINGSVSFNLENCKKVIAGYDFVNNDLDPMDDNGHGTHVTGIISSDDSYARGIANGTKIMIAKVLDSNGEGDDSGVISGIDWCINNSAQIISMSLGGDEHSGTCDDDILAKAVNDAANKGVSVIVAAGNSGQRGITSPACASGAIAVGAVDKSKNVVGFSSKGPELDILAPGFRINSTIPYNQWTEKSGTSMATPFISGVIALMIEANPSIYSSDIKRILTETSDPVNKCYECTWSNGYCSNAYGTEISCTRDVTGSGIVNAFKAVNYFSSPDPRYYNIVEPTDPSVYSPSASYRFSANWAGSIDKVTFEFNGANYTDLESLGNVYSKTLNSLPTGTFYYRWYANDTSNNWNSTDLLSFTVSKASSSCSLTGLSDHVYGSSDTPVCSCTGDGVLRLYRNDVDKTNWNSTTIIQEAGSFNWICNITEGVNYNSSSSTKLQTIVKATQNIILTILPSQSVVYPIQTNTTCSISSISNEVTPSLFRNGSQVNNPDVVTMLVGDYVYTCNNTETQNYTINQAQKTLVVNPSLPVVAIYSPLNNTSYYKLNVLLNFTIDKPTSWIGYSLNKTANKTISGSVNMTGLTDGWNNVTVYAKDSSNNIGSSFVKFFYCLGDINSDWKIDLKDVSFVAKLFGCNAGNTCYNSTADLNDDGKIDMMDVSKISRRFGVNC